MNDPTSDPGPPVPPAPGGPPTLDAIEAWLVDYLARLVKCTPEEVDVTEPFDRLGLDSATAVGVTLELEDWLGRAVDPAMLFDFPSIRLLARELARGGGAHETEARRDERE